MSIDLATFWKEYLLVETTTKSGHRHQHAHVRIKGRFSVKKAGRCEPFIDGVYMGAIATRLVMNIDNTRY